MRDERQYVVEAITAFLNDTGGRSRWDWHGFTSAPLRDVELDRIRRCAAAVPLPLDAQGEATLRDLLEQADLVRPSDPAAPAPWSMQIGALAGLAFGGVLWWLFHLEGASLFHDLHLFLLPAAAGAFIAALRNSRLKVGAYDPRVVDQNRKGRV